MAKYHRSYSSGDFCKTIELSPFDEQSTVEFSPVGAKSCDIPRKKPKVKKWRLWDGLFNWRKKNKTKPTDVYNSPRPSLQNESQSDTTSNHHTTYEKSQAIITAPRIELENIAEMEQRHQKTIKTNSAPILFDVKMSHLDGPGTAYTPHLLENTLENTSVDKNCSLLNVEIPNTRMDRYSVMFEGPLQRSQAQLAARSHLSHTVQARGGARSPLEHKRQRIHLDLHKENLINSKIYDATNSPSQDPNYTLSSSSVFSSEHTISTSTSISSITPPRSATSIKEHSKEQLQKNIASFQPKTFPRTGCTIDSPPKIGLVTSVKQRELKSNIKGKVSGRTDLDRYSYEQLEGNSSLNPSSSHEKTTISPISLQQTFPASTPTCANFGPAIVVTTSPLDAFAQAAHEQIDCAVSPFDKGNAMKPSENHTESSLPDKKDSERKASTVELASDKATTIATVGTTGGWENDDQVCKSGVNLRVIDHGPVTLTPKILVRDHRRSEMAIVERISSVSNF